MTPVVLASLLCAFPPARGAAPPAGQSPQQPLAEDEIRERIDTFMRTLDTRISDDQWRALGARGAAILEGMAQDRTLFPTRRAKAVVGLTAIGSPTSSNVLLSLAQSPREPLNVRVTAVLGAPGVVPASELPAALKPVLETADADRVRAAAAEVLSRHGGCDMVRAQARRERDPLPMQRAVQSCDKK
jgi:hypothetical protein